MELTAIDLFSGGGGASLGLHRVDGVNLRAAAEINDKVREPYNQNLPVEAADVDLTDEDALSQICEKYGLQPSDFNLVIGCPPCQKYSSLQDTTPPLDDGPKNKLLNVYIDLILTIAPKVVVFENVPERPVASLLRGFSASRQPAGGDDDRAIRDAIIKEVDHNTGVMVDRLNVIVSDGKVQLWGLVESKEQRWAVQVAAENIAGVKEVENNLGFVPRGMGGV